MDDRNNTIAMMTLAACATALAASIGAGMYFHAERPEKMGYPIEGVEEEGEGGAAAKVDIATLLPTADAAKGADVFKKCTACHTIAAGGASGIGPNLHGVLGEAVASPARAFAFSDALKGVGGSWDFQKMDAWLTSPRKFAPGTKMTFAGLGNAQDRANLLVYLNSEGSNLPLPAAAGPATPEEAAAENAATAELENGATPASGAPSRDPAAADSKAAEAVVK